jgi:dihydropteroate synthase
VTALAADGRVPVSIDTYRATVARAALERGATIVNDVSGLQYDDALGGVVATSGAAIVLMHNRGRSREMYQQAEYGDVGQEITSELTSAIERARTAGIPRHSIVVDPGIGFAKRADHSWKALASLGALGTLDLPILIGPSRKSFLTAAIGDTPPSERDWATAAAVTAGVLAGAHIVRVHAVREMVHVVRAADRILTS